MIRNTLVIVPSVMQAIVLFCPPSCALHCVLRSAGKTIFVSQL